MLIYPGDLWSSGLDCCAGFPRGIDIGKAGLVAAIRVPSDKDPARRAAETRSFGTTKREVLALADWLRCWQVPAVVMEATSDYVRREGA